MKCTKCPRKFLKWTDKWKCQCLMIFGIGKFLKQNPVVVKILEITIITLDFLTLALAIMSLKGREQIEIFYPIYNHYLVNPAKGMQSLEYLEHKCHYFDDLSLVEFVGFDMGKFFRIRLVVMIIIFITDFLGLIISQIHENCGNKMYVISLFVSTLFFVIFPSEFSINFGEMCIQNSIIFRIYRLEFMISFNIAILGLISLCIMGIIVTMALFAKKCCNLCQINNLFYEIIICIGCMPFVTIAVINFTTSLWTSEAFINLIALMSLAINYLLYNAGISETFEIDEFEDGEEEKVEHFWTRFHSLMRRPKQEEDLEDEFVIQTQQRYYQRQKKLRQNQYQSWQNQLYRQFHQT